VRCIAERKPEVTYRLVGQPSETSRYYARGRDHHLLFWCARFCPDSLDGLNNIHAFDDFAKHNVPPVEPRCDNGRDEELRTVRVGTGVGHREQSWFVVLQLEVLIVKTFSVDRTPASPVMSREIAALQHEIRDDPMKRTFRVSETVLSRSELTEILRRTRHHVIEQAKDDSASRFRVDRDIEEHIRQRRFCC